MNSVEVIQDYFSCNSLVINMQITFSFVHIVYYSLI